MRTMQFSRQRLI